MAKRQHSTVAPVGSSDHPQDLGNKRKRLTLLKPRCLEEEPHKAENQTLKERCQTLRLRECEETGSVSVENTTNRIQWFPREGTARVPLTGAGSGQTAACVPSSSSFVVSLSHLPYRKPTPKQNCGLQRSSPRITKQGTEG